MSKDSKLLMAQLIDKREEQLEIEQYLLSAMACGIKIEQHGGGWGFQEKVERYRALLRNYYRRSSAVNDGTGGLPTNLKLSANFTSSKRAGGNVQNQPKGGGKPRSPAHRRLDSDMSVRVQGQ